MTTLDATDDRTLPREGIGLACAYVAPDQGLEAGIAEVFSSVLRVAPVGRDDDFFDLGGDSLAAEQIAMALKARLDVDLPLSALFDHTTPGELAGWISGTTDAGPAVPVFMVHARHGYVFPDQSFLAALPSHIQLETLELPGLLGGPTTPGGIEGLAKLYADRIEERWPEGPVRLASFCTGWLVVTELVRQLDLRGRRPDRVVLLDPDVPGNHYGRFREEIQGQRRKRTLRSVARQIIGLRPFDGSWKAEFDDPVLYWHKAARWWLLGVFRLPGNNGLHHRVRKRGFRYWPVARLLAAYRHFWPEPCPVPAHIIASRDYLPHLEGVSEYWNWALPGHTLEVVADRHQDLNGAQGAIAGAALAAAVTADPTATAGQGVATQPGSQA